MEEAKVEKDFTKINDYIKEYLNFNNYGSTLECFEAEEKTKKVTARDLKEAINKVPTVSDSNFRIRTWTGSHVCTVSTKQTARRPTGRKPWKRTIPSYRRSIRTCSTQPDKSSPLPSNASSTCILSRTTMPHRTIWANRSKTTKSSSASITRFS